MWRRIRASQQIQSRLYKQRHQVSRLPQLRPHQIRPFVKADFELILHENAMEEERKETTGKRKIQNG
jgi:hypothetical protein